jgi:hypothetical protein
VPWSWYHMVKPGTYCTRVPFWYTHTKRYCYTSTYTTRVPVYQCTSGANDTLVSITTRNTSTQARCNRDTRGRWQHAGRQHGILRIRVVRAGCVCWCCPLASWLMMRADRVRPCLRVHYILVRTHHATRVRLNTSIRARRVRVSDKLTARNTSLLELHR